MIKINENLENIEFSKNNLYKNRQQHTARKIKLAAAAINKQTNKPSYQTKTNIQTNQSDKQPAKH